MNKLFILLLSLLIAMGYQLAAQQPVNSGTVQLEQYQKTAPPIQSIEGFNLEGRANLPHQQGAVPPPPILANQIRIDSGLSSAPLTADEQRFLRRGHENIKELASLAARVKRKTKFYNPRE